MKTILVTGSAGFIGANLVLRLLEDSGIPRHSGLDHSRHSGLDPESLRIVGLDNLND